MPNKQTVALHLTSTLFIARFRGEFQSFFFLFFFLLFFFFFFSDSPSLSELEDDDDEDELLDDDPDFFSASFSFFLLEHKKECGDYQTSVAIELCDLLLNVTE